MPAPSQTPSSAELTTEVSGLLTGLGILTMALFPIALPGLLLFVVAPLVFVAIAGLLLAIPLVLPFWLARFVVRSWSARRRSGVLDLESGHARSAVGGA
jgi:hypothetical protein